MGRCAIYRAELGPLLADLNLVIIRADRGKVDPWYLEAYLKSDRTRALLRRRAKQAVNQASVNMVDVASLPFVLPLDDVLEVISGAAVTASRLGQQALSLLRLAEALSSAVTVDAFRCLAVA